MWGKLKSEETATYWPQVSLTIAALLCHSAGLLNRGPEAQGLCLELVLTPRATATGTELQLELQLNEAVCGTWLYNCFYVPLLLVVDASALNSARPQVKVISSTGCICFFRLFTLVHLLIDGSVEGQYVTLILSSKTRKLWNTRAKIMNIQRSNSYGKLIFYYWCPCDVTVNTLDSNIYVGEFEVTPKHTFSDSSRWT